MESKKRISIFQKYLSVWVIICMVVGVLLGRFLPQVPEFLNRFEYARVSVPMAIAVPLVLQTFFVFAIAYLACKLLKLPHDIAAPAGMIGASNFFELAVAVAIALFGTTSPAAPATTVGVLTEVPVMLFLVSIANKMK